MSAKGPLARLRARLLAPREIAEAAAGASGRGSHSAQERPSRGATASGESSYSRSPEPSSEEDEFEHAPDATPDEVPAPKKVGFDGRELKERGPQSGHTPTGGGMGAGGF